MRAFIVVAAAIAATAVSFAVAVAANQGQQRVAVAPQPNAVDREVLKELKGVNRGLKVLNHSVGTPILAAGLREEVATIKRAVEATNSSLTAPIGSIRGDLKGIDDLLKEICRAVRPAQVGYFCL